jgi:hypothetical protein
MIFGDFTACRDRHSHPIYLTGLAGELASPRAGGRLLRRAEAGRTLALPGQNPVCRSAGSLG